MVCSGASSKSGTARTTAYHTALQGDQNALKQLMVNTDSNTSKVKGSILSTNKQKYHNAGQSKIENHVRPVSGKADSNPANKQIQASTIQVSECYPVAISNRFQVLDNNQDVQVNTSGEVDSQSVHSHTYEQQLQAEPSIRQTIVEPDPNLTIADLSAVPEYQKCKEQIGHWVLTISCLSAFWSPCSAVWYAVVRAVPLLWPLRCFESNTWA